MSSNRTWASVVRGGMRRIVGAAAALPGINHGLRAAHEVEFAQGRPMNALRGVYRDFGEAIRSAPRTKPLGYDHPVMAGMYRENLDRLDPLDYPVLYWMRPVIEQAGRVFDFGGHVGISYYGFQRHLPFPDSLSWTICDVPAVVLEGAELAQLRGTSQLHFTTRFAEADGVDILLAAGSLQYVEDGFLARALGQLREKPRHVIIQRTPLHDHRAFVTLQATGLAFCPYNVAHRATLIEGLTTIGYELVDSWTSPRMLEIPFHPECTLQHYSGLYFQYVR